MLGHLIGPAGGVVGDKQRADMRRGQRCHGAGNRLRAAEDGPVKVKQQAIMVLCKAFHEANSATRSSASVTPSTSAAAARRNHCSASSPRSSASRVSAYA